MTKVMPVNRNERGFAVICHTSEKEAIIFLLIPGHLEVVLLQC